MTELILTVILFSSAVSAGLILLKKIPVLVKLPETAPKSPRFPIGSWLKKAAGKVPLSGKFNYEFYLQKILSKIRVLTLKTESKTGNWLDGLRQRINKKNHRGDNDTYWDDLKKK